MDSGTDNRIAVMVKLSGKCDAAATKAAKADGTSKTYFIEKLVHAHFGLVAQEPGQRGRVSFLAQVAGSIKLTPAYLKWGHDLEAQYGKRYLGTEKGKQEFAAEFLAYLKAQETAIKPKAPKNLPKPVVADAAKVA